MTAVALILAESSDHVTLGDAAFVFALLVGMAAVFWALGR